VAMQKFAVTAILAKIETMRTQKVFMIIPIPVNLVHVANITRTMNVL
jgi:hypothetical protein